MDLFEHQGKELFEKHGLPRIKGVVCEAPEEAGAVAEQLGGGCVVKVQVQAGGRGKGGGIVIAKTPDEAEAAAKKMFDEGFKDMPVTRVLVEQLVDIKGEFYMAITLDRSSKTYVAMTSSQGGVDIEHVADESPESIRRAKIDPLLGLKPYQASRLVGGFPEEARAGAAQVLHKIWDILVAEDATLVEVNPLVLLGDGSVLPLDAKVTIDDNALYRHPETVPFAEAFHLDPTEARAKEKGLQYVKLDGEVGVIGNGAGLVMSTLDVVAQAGGAAANFLDAGGGADADLMATALEVILSDPAVRSVLVNIFGGITRCDLVAEGILEALKRVDAHVSIVVRLDGTNAEQGRKLLAEANNERIITEDTMLSAAARAVELAKEGA